MKYLLSIIFLLPFLCTSQTLVENKTDEFTKHNVKRTSYEIFIQNFKWNLFFRVSKIDDQEYLDVKMMVEGGGRSKYYTIDRGMKLMVILENDSIITLSNLEYTTSCRGCGARGFSGSTALGLAVSYPIYPIDHHLLKSSAIKKIRIYTTDGYIEDEVKEKRSKLIIELLALIE